MMIQSVWKNSTGLIPAEHHHIFDLVLVFILRWKCLIVFGHILVIWVFHSFSRRKVIAFVNF